jgi:hypothetical protein
MKKIICSFLFVLLMTKAHSQQNLVPNGSFEVYSQCPDPATLDPMPDNMIDLATSWGNPTGWSPDYFAACVSETSGYNVPNSGWGFQNARTGNAYAGLVSMAETDAREYIQTELTESLIAGKQYSITFYVSFSHISTYASNNIGAYFSNTPISVTHSSFLPYTPQISNNPFTNPLTDTLGWTEVSGVFIAQGGEKYMTIGNFNNDASTDTTNMPYLPSPAWNGSYHYIDDVSVFCLDCTVGISETSIESRIGIFPNPATDYLIVSFDDVYPERIALYNSIGAVLFAEEQVSDRKSVQIDISQYNSGFYFIKIKTKNTNTNKRFLITK